MKRSVPSASTTENPSSEDQFASSKKKKPQSTAVVVKPPLSGQSKLEFVPISKLLNSNPVPAAAATPAAKKSIAAPVPPLRNWIMKNEVPYSSICESKEAYKLWKVTEVISCASDGVILWNHYLPYKDDDPPVSKYQIEPTKEKFPFILDILQVPYTFDPKTLVSQVEIMPATTGEDE